MPNFQTTKQEPKILEFPSGRELSLVDIPVEKEEPKTEPQKDIGIPLKEFIDEIYDFKVKDLPIERVNQIIESVDEIKDKEEAKIIVKEIYDTGNTQ